MYGFIKIFGIVLFLAVVVGLLSPNKDLPASSITSSSTTSPAPAPPPPAPKPGEQWIYSQHEDKMGKGTNSNANVYSTNTVEFSFPYTDPQRAILTLRTHPRLGKDVMFRIQHGQFLCSSHDGCSVLVRFDDKKAQTFSATGPKDNSSDLLFINDYPRFVGNMLKAKRVRIAANIYQEGAPVFDFDVSGFDAAKYKPKN